MYLRVANPSSLSATFPKGDHSLLEMIFAYLTVVTAILAPVNGQLTSDFYEQLCPHALSTIRTLVEAAIVLDPRMGASLVRLHFHDCFVNGCDASVLLDDSTTFTGEKTAKPNNNSLRGFELIDLIKVTMNTVCLGNVVSCADILAVTARDSIVALGGSSYKVLLGRRDSKNASKDDANTEIPRPTSDLPDLIDNFKSHGLSVQEFVVLSGAHTLGFARCTIFRSRLYNDTSTIDHGYASVLQEQCPLTGGDNLLSPFDETPAAVDTLYYKNLLENKGLLHSDQQLFQGDGSDTDSLVQYYSENNEAFWDDLGSAMINMGNISPLTGIDGEIRENCRFVN